MNATHPHICQADRDFIEDVGLVHLDGRTGAGVHAQHQEEATPA